MIQLTSTPKRIKDDINMLLQKYEVTILSNPEFMDIAEWINSQCGGNLNIIYSENIPDEEIHTYLKWRTS